MFLQAIIFCGTTWAISAIVESLLKPKTELPRIGANPGPLNLRVWWARWKWHKHGHSDVIKTYEQVKPHMYIIVLTPLLKRNSKDSEI
jgi:hypothetical protein